MRREVGRRERIFSFKFCPRRFPTLADSRKGGKKSQSVSPAGGGGAKRRGWTQLLSFKFSIYRLFLPSPGKRGFGEVPEWPKGPVC